jgi:hypothetical protein
MEGLGNWRAVDLYESVQTVLEKFLHDADDTALRTLRQTVTSGKCS